MKRLLLVLIAAVGLSGCIVHPVHLPHPPRPGKHHRHHPHNHGHVKVHVGVR